MTDTCHPVFPPWQTLIPLESWAQPPLSCIGYGSLSQQQKHNQCTTQWEWWEWRQLEAEVIFGLISSRSNRCHKLDGSNHGSVCKWTTDRSWWQCTAGLWWRPLFRFANHILIRASHGGGCRKGEICDRLKRLPNPSKGLQPRELILPWKPCPLKPSHWTVMSSK